MGAENELFLLRMKSNEALKMFVPIYFDAEFCKHMRFIMRYKSAVSCVRVRVLKKYQIKDDVCDFFTSEMEF